MRKILLFTLSLLVLTGCGKKPTQPKAPAPFVELGEAISKTVPYVIRTIGNTKAYQSVTIQPQVSGALTGYYFADGADVEMGDLLFTIDPKMFEAELEQAKGEYLQAKAALGFSEDKVERYQNLLPDDFVSQLDYDQYVSDKKQAVGKLVQSKGSVDQAAVNLGYCTITAPFHGRCGRHLIDPGNIVSKESELLTINMITPIYAMITVAERYFFDIQKYSQKADGGLKVNLSVIGNDSVKHVGTLDFINNTVDQNSGTLTLRAVVKNEDRSLWPGQFLNAEIVLYEIPDAVLVPEEAVNLDTKGSFVWIADTETQTVTQSRVQTGQTFDNMVVVREGVKSGDKVVTSGQLSLRPGSSYQLKTEKKSP